MPQAAAESSIFHAREKKKLHYIYNFYQVTSGRGRGSVSFSIPLESQLNNKMHLKVQVTP